MRRARRTAEIGFGRTRSERGGSRDAPRGLGCLEWEFEALNRRTQEADGLGSGARSRGWSADVRYELLVAMRAYLMFRRK